MERRALLKGLPERQGDLRGKERPGKEGLEAEEWRRLGGRGEGRVLEPAGRGRGEQKGWNIGHQVRIQVELCVVEGGCWWCPGLVLSQLRWRLGLLWMDSEDESGCPEKKTFSGKTRRRGGDA